MCCLQRRRRHFGELIPFLTLIIQVRARGLGSSVALIMLNLIDRLMIDGGKDK